MGGAKQAEQLAWRVENAIASASLPTGARWGCEWDLAGRFEVGLGVAREALAIMEMRGSCFTRKGPGGGVFVARPSTKMTAQAIANYLLRTGVTKVHCDDARRFALAAPADRRTDAPLQLLIECLAELEVRLCQSVKEDDDTVTVDRWSRIDGGPGVYWGHYTSRQLSVRRSLRHQRDQVLYQHRQQGASALRRRQDRSRQAGGGHDHVPGRGRHPRRRAPPHGDHGYPAYDLAEFFFDDLRVPAENVMLGEGRALEVVMKAFAYDRMDIAARSLGEAELAFKLALDFVKERRAFGQPVFDFQNTQFVLADMKTEIEVGRQFLYHSIRKLRAGSFGLLDGAMAKLWLPEMSHRVVDKALQMFGGSGFMEEMPISKLYRANRLNRLYGGTSELQKVAIAKSLR